MVIPDRYRHIDWATYGLYSIHRLSMETEPSDSSLREALAWTSAYGLYPDRVPRNSRCISEVLLESSGSAAQKWLVHKQVSAGIRYAFLADFDVARIAVADVNVDPSGGPTSVFELLDGSHFTLFSFAHDEIPSASLVLLQGADPTDWYDVVKWSMMRPLAAASQHSLEYPLSASSDYEPQFADLLSEIGASRAGRSAWLPPPATSSNDMLSYVRNHPSLPRELRD